MVMHQCRESEVLLAFGIRLDDINHKSHKKKFKIEIIKATKIYKNQLFELLNNWKTTNSFVALVVKKAYDKNSNFHIIDNFWNS